MVNGDFRYFLLGREFKLITDHKALTTLDDRQTLRSSRIERWIERMEIFNFKVEHKKGIDTPHLDGLSNILDVDEINFVVRDTEDEFYKIILEFHKKIIYRESRITWKEFNKTRMDKDKATYERIKKVLKDCVECKLNNLIKTNISY